MKKRFLSALLVIAMLCALLPQTAIVANAETYSGKCGDDVTWELDTETGVLIFYGTGEMADYSSSSSIPWYPYTHNYFIRTVTIGNGVTSICSNAFEGCTGLTSVAIGNNVESIGAYAFFRCTGLTSITIPDSVTSIGAYAFSGCAGLTSVTIPNSVTSIGAYAFSGCAGLTNVTIPGSVTSIDEYAFENCTGLTSISIPASVTSIGYGPFRNCTGLKAITVSQDNLYYCNDEYGVLFNKNKTKLISMPGGFMGTYAIPNSVKRIDDYSFEGCTGLTSVTIPDSVTSIGWYAFEGCKGLTSVTIPYSVTSIGGGPLCNCTGLKAITVSQDNLYYCNDEYGVLFNKNKTKLISMPGGFMGTYAIPDSVTRIDEYAFEGCAGLTSVNIPDSVTSIGNSAFDGCKGLTSVTIPASVTSIGYGPFRNCTGLKAITVSQDNLYYCNDEYGVLFDKDKTTLIRAPGGVIETYSIPDSVTSIGYNAFSSCLELTSITIPDSVTGIDIYAFDGCTGLTDVYYLGKKSQWENIYIESWNDPLINADKHYSVHELDTGIIIKPTCTDKGYTTYTCLDCGDSFTDDYTDALGHNWGEWVYNNDATYDADGTKTRTCKNDPTHVETVTAEGTKLVKPTVKFSDVADGAFYAEAVAWAVSHDPQVTNGMTATTFAPSNKCTRAQVVTFLWRAAGCPEPTSSNNPFADVKSSAYYYKAVMWAVEKGVTSGMSATKFAPNAECTRGQVVTFLWRAKGKPAPTKTAHKFTDVDAKGFYYNAMLWAVETGVTNGVSDTKFAPNNTCTRGQVVTFLYRAFK